jgi:hypothetical protein
MQPATGSATALFSFFWSGGGSLFRMLRPVKPKIMIFLTGQWSYLSNFPYIA